MIMHVHFPAWDQKCVFFICYFPLCEKGPCFCILLISNAIVKKDCCKIYKKSITDFK